MKKVSIVIVLVMLILCACNQQSDIEGKPTETIESSTLITSNDEEAILKHYLLIINMSIY